MKNSKYKYLFVAAIGITLWSCQKDEVPNEYESNNEIATGEIEDELSKFENYNPNFAYKQKGATLTDIDLIKSLLSSNTSLDIDEENKTIQFLDSNENEELLEEDKNLALRSSAPLVLMRGWSKRNGKAGHHYGWHRKSNFNHSNYNWYHHHKKRGSTNWKNGNLNRLRVFNYHKRLRLRVSLQHNNNRWIHIYQSKRSSKNISVNGSKYKKHSLKYVK